MNFSEPKTTRGKAARFFLENLPGLLFIFILFGIVFLLYQQIDEKKKNLAEELKAAALVETPAVNVVTLKVIPTVLQDKINLPGAIEPWTRLELKSEISGIVEEMFVQEGATVKKGQTIARIKSKDYQIALESAKAAYDLAQANLIRNKILHSQGASPQANLDQQQTQLRMTKAALDEAELRLSRCQITAPIDGFVSRLDAKVGMLLSFGTPVAEILEIDRVKAVVAVPESDVAAVRMLTQAQVAIQALDGEQFDASVHFLARSPDSLARAYRLELMLPNKDGRILSGMFVRANLVKTVHREAIAVPLYAVVSRNNEQFVYVEEHGMARRKNVQTGFLEGWLVLIASGLKAGDNVIIQGHRNVEDGQTVKTVKSIVSVGEMLP